MAQKIIGAQHDFSYGEVDVTLKRNDEHPARKAGLRQCANMRILNSKALQNRPGRAAKFPAPTSLRIEEVTMSPGNIFRLAFGINEVIVKDAAGSQVAVFYLQGNGAPLPWSSANFNQIVFAQMGLSIYITFAGMRPQVLTWDGVATWAIADYQELFVGGQKRTAFYRISPQGITITPSAQTGAITVLASAPVFTPAWVGTRIRYVNRQILITGYTSPTSVSGTAQETLPGSQGIGFAVDPHATFAVGDVVAGSVSGAKGIVTVIGVTDVQVQLLSTTTTTVTTDVFRGSEINTFAFLDTDVVAGPGGSLEASSVSVIVPPQPVTFWDNEIMNDLRGYPASCFVDQFRLGFCDFPSVPNGIGWSAINSPNDLYVVGASVPNGAMFELAPDKVQVQHVAAGPESSEFVFCDHKIYYIKIDAQNPLKPGSVSFQTLSSDGAATVQPRAAQGFIFYVSAGGNSVMVISAPGAYYRPFEADNLTEFHSHLFGTITALAAPNADTPIFSERYVYALNADGSLACGKYESNQGKISVGWVPWSGAGAMSWISALNATVMFTTSYFGDVICETLDDRQYLDAALPVNALPAPFTPPAGKGPLWWIPSQSVSLMDQVTRSMGTYQIDADGNIIPQGNGGEDLTAISLVAGQPWTSTVEPFCPNAPPGADSGQRMKMRQVTSFLAYVIHSTGFVMGGLFSGMLTPTSPALGTLMNERRFTAWMQGDDPTLPPPERETAESHPPPGSTYDPRVVLIKDTPGPLQLLELTVEVSI